MNRLLKDALVSLAGTPAGSKAVSVLERTDARRSDLLRVLTYHRVGWPDERPDLDPTLISAVPDQFAAQMEFLKAEYRVVSIEEVFRALHQGVPLAPRSVLITFDDAYEDFGRNAWPVLQRLQLPVTLFVPTAYPDAPDRAFWWDRLHETLRTREGSSWLETRFGRFSMAEPSDRRATLRKLKQIVKSLPQEVAMSWIDEVCGKACQGTRTLAPSVLGWDALRVLAQEGVTLAPHTRTHPLMTQISPGEARSEAAGALRDLEREIGTTVRALAYPSGAANDDVVGALKDEAFELAFTTERGINSMRDANRLRLCRINVGRRTSLSLLRAQLLPWSAYLW